MVDSLSHRFILNLKWIKHDYAAYPQGFGFHLVIGVHLARGEVSHRGQRVLTLDTHPAAAGALVRLGQEW